MSALPNILWICTEHQRFDTIHALGNPHIRTPNLDRLATEGCAFTHAFAQNPVCTPSRSSFLTGRYPVTTRCRQNGQNLPDDEILITRELADLGYDCGLAGKLHVCAAQSGSERRINDGYRMYEWSHGSTARHGGRWIEWLAAQGKSFADVYKRSPVIYAREVSDAKWHQTTWCFDRALEFMQEERTAPWLVSINPFAAHDPFDLLHEYFDRYDPDALPSPRYRPGELDGKPAVQRGTHEHVGYDRTTDRQRREMVAAYYATVEHIDRELGRLLDWLEASGQRRQTLVIFHADHGELLGDHGLFAKGAFLYDPCIRVPLVLSWPGVLPEGVVRDDLVELVDVAPTIRELIGIDIPVRVQGRSLLPLIRGTGEEQHRAGVYAEYYHSNPAILFPGQEPVYATMWRTAEHKVVVYHGTDDGELYDLRADPFEHENLWQVPAARDLRFAMMRHCFDARVFVADPLPERVSGF